MKKSMLAAVLALGCVASSHADTLLGVYAGAHGWNMDTEGGFANDTSLTEFNFDDENKSSVFVALEHPIPLVPNIKVRRTGMDTSGDVTLTSTFTFGDQLFTVDSDLVTEVDMTQTDYILYYELFDNDLISFDFGLNGKYVDGELFVQDSEEPSIRGREAFSGVVPMLYSKLAVGLPFSGLGVYVEGSFLSIDDHSMLDYQAAVVYEFVDNLAVDIALQVGYRSVQVELEDLDDIYTDMDFSGVFAGIEVHF